MAVYRLKVDFTGGNVLDTPSSSRYEIYVPDNADQDAEFATANAAAGALVTALDDLSDASLSYAITAPSRFVDVADGDTSPQVKAVIQCNLISGEEFSDKRVALRVPAPKNELFDTRGRLQVNDTDLVAFVSLLGAQATDNLPVYPRSDDQRVGSILSGYRDD